MTVILASRFDITPEAVLAVAWKGEAVAVDAAALRRVAASRAAFKRYLDEDPNASVYGVNQGQGEMVGRTLDEDDRQRLARLKPLAAAVAFGEPYPLRVTRAMVLARFANLLGGHGMATPRLVEELAGMLNRGPIPRVPSRGQGGPGEILVLYALFAELSRRFELQAAERGALINGSPAAAAVLADAALGAERRLAVAEQVLALAIVAFNAPPEHYETVLGELLGGEHDRRAFERLAALLEGATECGETRPHQGPVSYRIVPHVLAQAHAAIGFARGLAVQSLSAVTHNPVWLAPDETHPLGRLPQHRRLSQCGRRTGHRRHRRRLGGPVPDSLSPVYRIDERARVRISRFPAGGPQRRRDRRSRCRRIPADGDRGLPRRGACGCHPDLHPGRGRRCVRAGRRKHTGVSRLVQVHGGRSVARFGARRPGGGGLAGAPRP